ncbi:MAG: hypothetical protein AAF560_09215 [Acidobacteriota bacterium]
MSRLLEPRRWLLLLFLFALPIGAKEAPRLDVQGQHLVLTDLPPILGDVEVKEHLTTGLTTSIQFSPRGRGQPVAGARVEIRYDLWDEIFLVAAGGIDGAVARQRLDSFEALEGWWKTLDLPFLDGSQLARPWPESLRINVDVVPFSQAEQDDTQRWFSESIDRRRSGTDATGRAVEKEPETLSRTFNLLLATSIRRQAVTSFHWSVPLAASAGGTP